MAQRYQRKRRKKFYRAKSHIRGDTNVISVTEICSEAWRTGLRQKHCHGTGQRYLNDLEKNMKDGSR